MGLSSSIIHVKDVDRAAVIEGLDACLGEADFDRKQTRQITKAGFYKADWHEKVTSKGPCYLVSDRQGQWVPIIQAFGYFEGAPFLWDLSHALSKELDTYTLALNVHDGDVFYYYLNHRGRRKDSYNSLPQYFFQERLTKAAIEKQRHKPEAFKAILPESTSLKELKELLDRGWWNAHKHRKLDEHGVQPFGEEYYVDEEERMTTFARLLEVNGPGQDYPYTAWMVSKAIVWEDFVALGYELRKKKPQRKGRAKKRG